MDKLLLIDDEADVLYSFRRIFNSPEIELTTAGSGEEALKIIPRLKPDLVLMDIRMGGLNGLETLRRLRQSDARLPVIMMTAYGTTQAAIEAMKLGAFDFIQKPFGPEIVRLKVEGALQLRDARRRQEKANATNAAFSADLAAPYTVARTDGSQETLLIGDSEPMKELKATLQRVARADATVHIHGESG
ncbi:MAG TPA: response regulator, partial [Candidatus Dormibacteraeota bacterium]|nr:response regulator [Candidatus Dormibacteraeota bacterium]